jgi:heme-degrading monooxygenase HmoA
MTVLMRADVPGMTSAQFDVVFKPLIDQLKVAPGFITHASGPVGGNYQVTEVWESQEAHERWVREVIVPTMQRAGLTEPPAIQYLPLDRFFTR